MAGASAVVDQYYLEHGVTTATYDDLVGPDKYIKQIRPARTTGAPSSGRASRWKCACATVRWSAASRGSAGAAQSGHVPLAPRRARICDSGISANDVSTKCAAEKS